MNKRKWLTIVLALAMVLVMMPAMAMADEITVNSAEDLASAITNASDGDNIVLGANITEDITIPAGKTITIDLGEYTLTNESGHTITNNGNLTITGNGTVDNVTHGKAAIHNAAGATAVLEGGTFTRSKETGNSADSSGGNSFYTIQNYGTMTIKDGVTVNQGADGNGKYSSLIENGWYDGSKNSNSSNAVMDIMGGTFSGGLNTIKNDDWGILTINNGTFKNFAQHAFFNANVATINGGTFTNDGNRAPIFTYGKWNDNYGLGKLTITDGLFKNTGSQIIEVTSDYTPTIDISGGTFSSEPDETYIASGYAVVEVDGKYIVGTEEQGSVDEKTVTVGSVVDPSLSEDEKEQAEAIAEEITADIISGEGLQVLSETAIKVDVVVTAVDMDNDTFTVSITPKDENGDPINVTGTVTVKLPAPDGFPTKNVYVKHTKESGDVYKYKATVSDSFITFTNPNGFSDFEVYVGSSSSSGYVQQKTLTFDTNGGSKIDAVTANYGKTIVLADYTTKRAGYDFAGWYKDKELTEKIEYAILDYDMTVYAKWSANGEPTEDADIETKIVLVINDKTAVVDGKAVSNDVAPLIVNGRTYTPARFVAEALGAKVNWNEATRTVTITKDDTSIVLIVDTTTAYVNGKAVKMDASAFIADGRTFTPSRFVAEQLGANVEWDEEARTVTIWQ